MCVATPPLPNTPSWRGAQLKKAQGQFYLYLLGKNRTENVVHSPAPGVLSFISTFHIQLVAGSYLDHSCTNRKQISVTKAD
jgi:hypothetical protein